MTDAADKLFTMQEQLVHQYEEINGKGSSLNVTYETMADAVEKYARKLLDAQRGGAIFNNMADAASRYREAVANSKIMNCVVYDWV